MQRLYINIHTQIQQVPKVFPDSTKSQSKSAAQLIDKDHHCRAIHLKR